MWLAHISIFSAVFLVMLAIVNAIPVFFKLYRERYQTSSRQTARELDKFFLYVKPSKFLIAAGLLGELMGLMMGSWVLTFVLLIVGSLCPTILLSLWTQ